NEWNSTSMQRCYTLSHKTTKTEIMVYWKPPIDGWVKLNTDGGWLGGFAKYFELNVDSSVVDRVLHLNGNGSPLGGALINQIRHLLDLEWEVEVNHSYRESNKCADALANIGCTIDSHITYYDSCPPECHFFQFVEKDAL
ncbi:ethylene responsive transcription factor 1b, partial [Trifolium pratense]